MLSRTEARKVVIGILLFLLPVHAFPVFDNEDAKDAKGLEGVFNETTNSTGAGETQVNKIVTPTESVALNVELPAPEVYRVDYYDYSMLPPEDDIPALPERDIDVNEDYAGIYDYKGLRNGPFSRRRTLVTNLEQVLTRNSQRSKRSVLDRRLAITGSPRDQAETLATLLSVMKLYYPNFDVDAFVKNFGASTMTDADIENVMFLSELSQNYPIPDLDPSQVYNDGEGPYFDQKDMFPQGVKGFKDRADSSTTPDRADSAAVQQEDPFSRMAM